MMKKIAYSLALALSLCACGKKATTPTVELDEEEMPPVIIAYFSATGTTARVAKMMAESLQVDLLEIVPAEPYTAADLDWNDKTSRSTLEMQDSTARPALGFDVPDLSSYKLIYLGYPIWWGKAPRIINSFIEAANIDTLTQILPFATSGGSPVEPSAEALKATYPELRWEAPILLNNIGDDGLQTHEDEEADAE